MTDSLEAKKLLIIRIMQILEYYSDVNHPLTQEDIINKLYEDYGIEAERKAIGRNIALLQDMFERESMNKTATAIVIESDKRKGTFLDKRLFEDSELRLLIDGVLASKHISEKYSKDLIEKLSSLSNKYFKSNVKHVYSVKDWDKTENKALFWNIEVIDEAIDKSRQITFEYNKYGADKKLHKTSSHTASPYQLVLHNQHYYLVFLSEKWQKICHFRVDKITNIKITDEPSTPLRSVDGYANGLDYKNTPRRCRICLLTRSSELLSSATNALSIRWWTGSEKILPYPISVAENTKLRSRQALTQWNTGRCNI